MNILKKYYLSILLLLLSVNGLSQTFYVNAGLKDNATYRLQLSPCNFQSGQDTTTLSLYTCFPTNTPGRPDSKALYDDIAIDKDQNIWYVTTSGDLYKRNLSDTNCSYIGNFIAPRRWGAINGIVADSAGAIYAISNSTDTCLLLKYDASGFHVLGKLPPKMYSSGDLFFYEHRLFLLAYYNDAKNSFLTEIQLKDPSQSCRYMNLDSVVAFGAFSIKENNKSRAFLLESRPPDYTTSNLIEIDIPNKKVLKRTCDYPFLVRGAATYYDRTRDSSKCAYIPQSVNSMAKDEQPTVLNPCRDVIRISNALIKQERLRSIALYDISGRKIKNYAIEAFPNRLDISDVREGLYFLQIVFNDGKQCLQKVQKAY